MTNGIIITINYDTIIVIALALIIIFACKYAAKIIKYILK